MLTLGLMFGAITVGGIFWMYSEGLPSHESLAQYTPPTISRIYSGEGRVIDEFAQERRLFVPIEDVPDLVKFAFVSAEDKHFFTHKGYDVTGMVAAALEAVRSGGRNARGASTITQQVMKNFLLDGSRSVERKVKEIILATRLEQTLSKDKILELYMNEIFLGQNSYGVAAAAQTYFNKPLDQLSAAENVAKDVAKGFRKAAKTFAARATTAHVGVHAGMAVLVVRGALWGVGEHLVGLFGLFELFLGLDRVTFLVAVRVELHRQFAISLFDVFVGSVFGNTQNVVVVAFGHGFLDGSKQNNRVGLQTRA